jgi:hypothetical protein
MTAVQFKVKRHVTVKLLKVEDGKEYFVKFNGAIHKAVVNEAEQKRFENAKAKYDSLSAEEKAKVDPKDIPTPPNPPQLAQVIDLTSGEVVQIIIGSVLESELKREYPNDAYVGKGFSIQKAKIQGKRYAAYQIAELELEDEAAETAEAEKPARGAKK